jgi:hypothetical protein
VWEKEKTTSKQSEKVIEKGNKEEKSKARAEIGVRRRV